jgi:hypothetical protein
MFKILFGLTLLLTSFSATAKDEALVQAQLERKMQHATTVDLSSNQKIKIKFGVIYEILSPLNLKSAPYATLYIGKRNPELSNQEYLTRMQKHIEDIRDAFQPYGMTSYQAFLTEDYELGYQVWNSKEDARAAFASPGVKPIFEEAQKILTPVLFKELTN